MDDIDGMRDSVMPAFVTSEGLRVLLDRLHDAGPGAWRHDREAADLMRFTADRYAALARKFEREPDDAAAAAFEAMLNDATRTAGDPWAVVSWAVRITLIAEQRSQGLLTSTSRARRPEYSVFHDAERFADRETDLTDYHPALHTDPHDDPTPRTVSTVDAAIEQTVELLRLLGWDPTLTATAIDYVTARLPDYGDRESAFEALRRDKAARVLLDLPHTAWIGLLRVTLGHPTATNGRARRGVLARLLIGETLTDLLCDPVLVRTAVDTRPPAMGEVS